jgi:TP901 family phage tail tape measure protein
VSRFVLTAQLQLQAPTNVGQVVQQIQNQLNNVRVNVQVQGAQQATRQINNVTNATNQATNAANALGRSFGLSIKRFAAFSIATRAVSLFTSGLSNAIKEAISFERELLKISQVTGKSMRQLRDLTDTITRLSTSLGVSSTSILSVSRILSQAGLSANETKIALDALAKSQLAPTFDDITETAEGAVAIFNQFRLGAEALEAQLGAINAVAGRFAVEAGDLIGVVRRVGGVFKAAGGELNELIALFTSVRATTRESAESIATGLRTIFTRIQRPKTIEFLRQYGVELLDLEGKFVGPFEATRRLSEALAGLEQGDITFVRIAEELGGFRQIGKVIPLLQQFRVAQEAYAVAQGGANSLSEDAAKAQAALAVRITKVKEEFLALVRSISESTSFQLFANTALNLASALIKLADALKPIIPLLTVFAGIKLATGLGSFVKGIGGGLRTPRGFATGGLVPGSGNRDTVPAMLTPGEFVIRKSSVSKLGAGNLAAMNENRYAAGGIVTGSRHMYGDNPPLGRSALARAFGIRADSAQYQRLGERSPRGEEFRRRATARLQGRKKGEESKQGTVKQVTIGGPFGASFLRGYGTNVNLESRIYDVIRNGNKTGVTALKNAITQSTKLPFEKAVPKGAGITVKATQGTSTFLDPKGSRIFDDEIMNIIPKAFDTAAKKFNGELSVKGPPKPLTSLLSKSAISSIEGQFFEAYVRAITNNVIQDEGKKDAIFDFSSINQEQASKLFGTKKFVTPNEFKNDPNPANIASILAKAAGQVGGIRVQKFATGGAVGTDTVPALLTPGEFVINRSSAQKIGYGSLNRMNKVGKYAKGGVVQHFAGGTTGSGAKPKGGGGFFAFDTSPVIKDLKAVSNKLGFFQTSLQQAATNIQQIANVSPAYASALQNSAVFTKLSGDKQKEITDKITNKITALQKSGKSEEEVKKALDDYSKKINQQSKTALGKEKKAALQKAGFTPKSVKQALITGDETVIANETGKKARRGANAAYRSSLEKERMPGETLKATEGRLGSARQTKLKQRAVNIGNREASVGINKAQRLAQQEAQNLARSLNQASTSANQSAAADNMGAQASKNAAMGDNLDAQASKNAAQADQLEANASKAASGKVSPGGGGMMGGGGGKGGGGKGGGMMGGGMDKALGLTMAAASIQAFLPPLDESSSALMQLTHSGLSAVTMLGSLMLVVQTLLPNLTLAQAGMFLTGNAGTLVAGKLSFLGASASAAAGTLATIAGPLIAVVGGFFLINTALKSAADAFFNYSADLKKAQKDGNAEEAGRIAEAQANTNKALIVVSAILTAALTAAAFSAGLLGAPFAILAGVVMAAVAAFMYFSSESSEAAKTHAAAVAEQVNAQKALTQANKDATEAMKQFEDGTISAFDAVASTSAAGDAISKLQQRNNEADQAVANQTGLQRYMNQSSQAEAKAQRDDELKKAEEELVKTSQPAMNALSRQIAATGGDFSQFQEQLKQANPGLYAVLLKNGFNDTEKAFENIAKEVERSNKAFNAMNLGFQSVAAVAGALTVTMDNYLASQEAGYIGLNNTIAMLEASVTSAAQGISDADFNAALGSASDGLRKLGASQGDIEKFEQNLGAINTAQKFFAKASEETRNALKAELKRGGAGTGGLTRSKFAEILVGQLDGVAPEVRDRIKDALENADIAPEDMEKLLAGDLSVLDKVLKDLGDTTLNQVVGPLKELAKYEQQLVNLAKKRYDAENKVVEASKNLVEAQMEAAEIIAKYGGPAFTPEMRAQGVLAQANIEGQAAGVTPLVTGSAAEFNARSAQIRQGLGAIGGIRAGAAANNTTDQKRLEGRSGAALAEQQKRLLNLAKSEYETAKRLISIKEQELKLIAEKNKLEKSSIEALVTGDITKFFEQQAAVGATASIALGSTRLQGAYGADALGLAAQDIKRQQEAGVTEIYGQQVGGSGGLAQRAYGAALSARGVSDGTALGMAQTAAGTTPEEEALKAEIRSLATTLPNYAAIQLQAAEQDLQVANIQMTAAEMQLEAAKRQMQQRAMAGRTPANPNNPQNPNAPNAPNAPDPNDFDGEKMANAMTGALFGSIGGALVGSFFGMPGIGMMAGGALGAGIGAYAFNKGGVVYANNGMFVPRGTDTVPAMLTPGEFVVRRSAVQRGNNLAILQSMNKGQSGVSTSGALAMADGGIVYARRGGRISRGNSSNQSGGSVGINPETVNKLSETFTQFNSAFSSFTGALTTFNSTLSSNIDKLNNTTFNVKLDATNINVNLNGGSFLAKLKDDIRSELMTQVASEISNYGVGQDGKLRKNSGTLTT